MKKIVLFTYLYHGVCLFSMLAGQLMKNGGMIRLFWMGDIAGAFVLPLVIAGAAMAAAMSEEKRVILQYPPAAAAVGAVGLARGILFFFVSGKNGFLTAMGYLLISFLFLTMWFLIFEISSKFMNGGTKFTKKRK